MKSIFEETDYKVIDSLPMTDDLREFAQGFLVVAIDASYAVRYIKAFIESAANPTKSGFAIIKTFARKAAVHWFKKASVHDLHEMKIYDFVRKNVAMAFRIDLRDFLAGIKLEATYCESHLRNSDPRWSKKMGLTNQD